MSKKDFKNNPALKFISEQKGKFGNITKENASDYSGEFFDKRASERQAFEMEKQDMYNKHNTEHTQHTDDVYNMYNNENVNHEEIEPKHEEESDILGKNESNNYTHNTEYVYNTDDTHITVNTQHTDNTYELKNQRLNLLLKPTVLKNLKKIAHIKRTSVNSLINNIAENYILSEIKIVKLYDELYKEN